MDKMKPAINLAKRQKIWDEYHRFECGYRKTALRKLTAKDSFQIYDSLYRLYCSMPHGYRTVEMSMGNLKTLCRVRRIFGKVGR